MITEGRNRTIAAVEHGGLDLEELGRLGLDPARILDFSVCTNPFGPSPAVHEILKNVSLEQYPDRDAQALRSALAEKFAISPKRIMAGNGASELIGLAAQAFIRPGTRVLVIGPTYGEYERSALLQGGVVRIWRAREEDRFAPVAQEIETELTAWRPRLVFLCNPNNPTGAAIDPEVILSWARRNPSTLFVVDEAYQKFAPGLPSLVTAQEKNLLILRSMTKDYALAGLRASGMRSASEPIIKQLVRVSGPRHGA